MTKLFVAAAAALFASTTMTHAQWKPVEGHLLTDFATRVDPKNTLGEYPRPQMVRKDWQSLNGLWQYAITDKAATAAGAYQGEILVPFGVESALSGVKKTLLPEQKLWYKRTFTAPDLAGGKRAILHFEAVDFEAAVSVNGKEVITHKGGSTPFEVDVTDALQAGENELTLAVLDPTNKGAQPTGKQRLRPEGIFYTPVSGIWQTVWLEAVPAVSVAKMKITPDLDKGELVVLVTARGGAAADVTIDAGTHGKATGKTGQEIRVKVTGTESWTPDRPTLYNFTVALARNGATTDTVQSYFAMRKIAIGKAKDGITRMLLNGEPVFQYGPLDQGWWPDGLLTPPSEEAMVFDIQAMKDIGWNMVRKHIKVEPARWYYLCDKLGLLVWQDMPSGMMDGRNQGIGAGDAKDAVFTDEEKAQFKYELAEMMDHLHNHPSIVVWVPFNEGWGQHDTNDVLKWTKKYDPSRLVDGPSGWTDRGFGDMHDMHNYPGPGMFPATDDRASVLGEFGGLGLPLKDHLWQVTDRNWGYRTYDSKERLQEEYRQLVRRMRPLIDQGLSAAVYTQLTDVENEVNGILTYDRKVWKIEADYLKKLHAPLYAPPRKVERVAMLPTSEREPQTWSYTFDQPAAGWEGEAFDASGWKTGPGGFGGGKPPGSQVRTEWTGERIFLRREFDLKSGMSDPFIRIHHDEDVEVFINGKKVYAATGHIAAYNDIPLDVEASVLKPGKNVIAVSCKQTIGGQYVDVGLVDYVEKK